MPATTTPRLCFPVAAAVGVLAWLAVLTAADPVWSAAPLLRAGAQPGGSQTERLQFTYGVDSSSWFWQRQQDEELAVGTASQRVSVPNPQSPATLPVAVEAGEPTKLAALRFDLAGRDVPEGSTVTGFLLTVAEGTEPGDTVPTVNPLGRELRACRADAAWSPGEADLWEARPEQADACVTGVRTEAEVDPEAEPDPEGGELAATWTFDLASLAGDWGEDPFANHGVVLGPVLPDDAGPTETWQVNLLLPRRDDPNTPVDEYEQTAGRTVVELAYLPGEAAGQEPGGEPGSGAPPAPAGGAGDVGGSPGRLDGAGGVPDPGAPPEAGDPSEAGSPPASEQPVPVAQPFAPRPPWYVWLLIPAALLAVMLVRGALVEEPATARPGGVIETIRRRNTRRRGGELPVPASLPARLAATFTRLGGRSAG
ncbi:MAG: hypothetical protein GEV12_09250 [Micromonosporaceae bacterium]|nr:hypothetical protein [Micromonosporaceae bacterium]